MRQTPLQCVSLYSGPTGADYPGCPLVVEECCLLGNATIDQSASSDAHPCKVISPPNNNPPLINDLCWGVRL